MTRTAEALPRNLQRAVYAAVALDLGPERVCDNAARAALWDKGDTMGGQPPEVWLALLRWYIPAKPRLHLLPPLPADASAPPLLPRVWSPHLSVLDAEFPSGERFVWYVPAKPANDTGMP